MAAKRKVDPQAGLAALQQVVECEKAEQAPRAQVATAVRFLLEELAALAPGGSVEVRVPPFGAVQCLAGLKHRRGTPPNVVEMSAPVWIALATGSLTWSAALSSGAVHASGSRADISGLLPVIKSL